MCSRRVWMRVEGTLLRGSSLPIPSTRCCSASHLFCKAELWSEPPCASWRSVVAPAAEVIAAPMQQRRGCRAPLVCVTSPSTSTRCALVPPAHPQRHLRTSYLSSDAGGDATAAEGEGADSAEPTRPNPLSDGYATARAATNAAAAVQGALLVDHISHFTAGRGGRHAGGRPAGGSVRRNGLWKWGRETGTGSCFCLSCHSCIPRTSSGLVHQHGECIEYSRAKRHRSLFGALHRCARCYAAGPPVRHAMPVE